MENIYEVAAKNRLKSYLILTLFFLFFSISVYLITYTLMFYFDLDIGVLGVAGLALIFSGITSFAGYYFSDQIVLTISQARPADRDKDFHFYTIAENLSIATGLPKPRLYVIEDSAPNAFATGRNPENAVICATTGLLEKLDRSELESVIAHEMSHIRNYDIRLMSIVSVLVGTIALLADIFLRVRFRGSGDNKKAGSVGIIIFILGILFAILSPIIAQVIQLAISRRREFMADAGSIHITRNPEPLIAALKKLEADTEPLEAANKATAHMYIVNPFKAEGLGARKMFSNLFNTHPPIDQRIEQLKRMA